MRTFPNMNAPKINALKVRLITWIFMLRRQGTTVASATPAPGCLDSYWRVISSLNIARKGSSMTGMCSSEEARDTGWQFGAWDSVILLQRRENTSLECTVLCSRKPWQWLSCSALSCSASENGQSFKKCDMYWVFMAKFQQCGGYRVGSVRICQKFPPCPADPMPAGSNMNLPLARDGG